MKSRIEVVSRILACDLARRGGFAWYESARPIAAAVLQPPKAVDAPWRMRFFPVPDAPTPDDVLFPTDTAAYERLPLSWIVDGRFVDAGAAFAPTVVAIERGHGAMNTDGSMRSAYQLGWRAGYLVCAVHNARTGARVFEINNQMWASKVGHHFADLFPRGSDARKRHSVKLARRLGVDIPISLHDAADALLIGLAVNMP